MDRAEVEKISKALGDETRLMIFEAISAGEHVTCGDLVTMRGVTPATVSHHLKILTEAGLVDCQRKGQFVLSRVVPEKIAEYAQALAKIAAGKLPREKVANEKIPGGKKNGGKRAAQLK
jgi:ArsR family transcriptional regulator, arsenate/arsenite/antimonite-responsive transcriptional repressor